MPPEYEVRLAAFQGPIELLLSLAEAGHIDVGLVPLAQVVQQYFEYLTSIGEVGPEALASFVLAFARLLWLKARRVLAPPDAGTLVSAGAEEPAGEELLALHEEHEFYRQVRLALAQREQEGLRAYLRLATLPAVGHQLEPGSVALADLVQALQRVLAETPEQVRPAPGPSLAARMAAIRQVIAEGVARLSDLLGRSASRLEVVVTFLALLELMRLGEVRAQQERLFGDILVVPLSRQ